MNRNIIPSNNSQTKTKYQSLKFCPRKNKIKAGLFTTSGKWVKPYSICPVCTTSEKNKKKRQLKITKYLKYQAETKSENYDADVEMDIDIVSHSKSKSKKSVTTKKTANDAEIELLSILIAELDTKPKKKYNLRKKKPNKNSLKEIQHPKTNKRCGKKNKIKNSKKSRCARFSVLFET